MSKNAVASVREPRIPYVHGLEQRFNVDQTAWRALVESIFPTAQTADSVILALSYCRARDLDPFKRTVHIVPIYDRNQKRMVDTVWPGIAELRTTAFRTGEYAGKDETKFGPDITQTFQPEKKPAFDLVYPEWAQVTVHRQLGDRIISFAGPKVYWMEAYASGKDKTPNTMWQTRPRGQLDKCAEAAALRTAFPEELGSQYTSDEAFTSSAKPVGGVMDGERDLAKKSTANNSRLRDLSNAMDEVDPQTGEVKTASSKAATGEAKTHKKPQQKAPQEPAAAASDEGKQEGSSASAAQTSGESSPPPSSDEPDKEKHFQLILDELNAASFGAEADRIYEKHAEWINLHCSRSQRVQLEGAVEDALNRGMAEAEAAEASQQLELESEMPEQRG